MTVEQHPQKSAMAENGNPQVEKDGNHPIPQDDVKLSLRKRIKTHFKTHKARLVFWAKHTTMHGWGHLVNEASTKSSRIFWLIILAFFTTFLIVTCVTTLEKFTNLPDFQASWSIEPMSEADGTSQDMPPITICPMNRISKRKADVLGLSDPSMIALYLATFSAKYPSPDYTVLQNRTLVDQIATWRANTGLTSKEITKYLTPSCHSLMALSLNGATFINMFDVNSTTHVCETGENEFMTITEREDSQFGICYRIMLKPNVGRKWDTGSEEAVSFTFVVHPDDDVLVAENTFWEGGIHLRIGNVVDTLVMQPGKRTYVGLRPTRREYTKASSSLATLPCKQKRERILYNRSEYETTTRQQCRRECTDAVLVAATCNCTIHLSSWNYSSCEIEQYLKCHDRIQRRSANPEMLRVKEQCIKDNCGSLCSLKSYQLKHHVTEFASQDLLPVIRKQLLQLQNLPTDSLPEATSAYSLDEYLIGLEVYFHTMDTEVLRIFPRAGYDQILSDIGGQLGLWAGVSLMTVIHFIGTVVGLVLPVCCGCCGEHSETQIRRETEREKRQAEMSMARHISSLGLKIQNRFNTRIRHSQDQGRRNNVQMRPRSASMDKPHEIEAPPYPEDELITLPNANTTHTLTSEC